MPCTFLTQSTSTVGNAPSSSPSTLSGEQPASKTVNNLVINVCFTSLPSKFNVAVELFTPFLASSPNQISISLSPQTPIPISSILGSSASAISA